MVKQPRNDSFLFGRGLTPQDELDFLLDSPYDHSYDTFPDKIDVFLQPETYGIITWRKLRNYKEIPPPPSIQYTFRQRKAGDVTYNDVSDSDVIVTGRLATIFFLASSRTDWGCNRKSSSELCEINEFVTSFATN